MSCYEWSHGTIVLPSAEFAVVRLHVQKAMTKKYEAMFASSQSFWKSLTPKQKSDIAEYRKALYNRRFEHDTVWLLDLDHRAQKPRRILRSDLQWPTNRTVDFHESDLSVTFDRKTRGLTYSVSENNHAREHAAATVLHLAVYEALAKVKWTHGTGGVILGNDEYNRESGYDHEGGGGSYVVDAFGYVGAKEAPLHMNRAEFLNGKGQWVHVEVSHTKRGAVGAVKAGRAPYQSRRWG